MKNSNPKISPKPEATQAPHLLEVLQSDPTLPPIHELFNDALRARSFALNAPNLVRFMFEGSCHITNVPEWKNTLKDYAPALQIIRQTLIDNFVPVSKLIADIRDACRKDDFLKLACLGGKEVPNAVHFFQGINENLLTVSSRVLADLQAKLCSLENELEDQPSFDQLDLLESATPTDFNASVYRLLEEGVETGQRLMKAQFSHYLHNGETIQRGEALDLNAIAGKVLPLTVEFSPHHEPVGVVSSSSQISAALLSVHMVMQHFDTKVGEQALARMFQKQELFTVSQEILEQSSIWKQLHSAVSGSASAQLSVEPDGSANLSYEFPSPLAFATDMDFSGVLDEVDNLRHVLWAQGVHLELEESLAKDGRILFKLYFPKIDKDARLSDEPASDQLGRFGVSSNSLTLSQTRIKFTQSLGLSSSGSSYVVSFPGDLLESEDTRANLGVILQKIEQLKKAGPYLSYFSIGRVAGAASSDNSLVLTAQGRRRGDSERSFALGELLSGALRPFPWEEGITADLPSLSRPVDHLFTAHDDRAIQIGVDILMHSPQATDIICEIVHQSYPLMVNLADLPPAISDAQQYQLLLNGLTLFLDTINECRAQFQLLQQEGAYPGLSPRPNVVLQPLITTGNGSMGAFLARVFTPDGSPFMVRTFDLAPVPQFEHCIMRSALVHVFDTVADAVTRLSPQGRRSFRAIDTAIRSHGIRADEGLIDSIRNSPIDESLEREPYKAALKEELNNYFMRPNVVVFERFSPKLKEKFYLVQEKVVYTTEIA